MSDFYPLIIASVKRETKKAISITFKIPEQLRDSFRHQAGQYLTVKTQLNGTEIRRAYSICEPPLTNNLKITIKEIEKGTFSKFANRQLKEGDVLEVGLPEGRFVYRQVENQAENIVAFAAGSGITPIMAIAKTVLTQPQNTFVLVYGNKSQADTIFYTELLQLKKNYPNRFYLYFLFSREHQPDSLFGRIDASTVNFILKNKHKNLSFSAFYLCGPKPMIDTVSENLKNQNIKEDKIYTELFNAGEETTEATEHLDGKTQVTLLLDSETSSFLMNKDSTILQAALDQGIDPPYSCQGGVCGSCIAKITEGKAVMKKNQILTDSEIEEGIVLSCQAYPTTETIEVDFDEV